jgi:hypothetical protein
VVSAIMMPFSFPMLSVGGGLGWQERKFESEEQHDTQRIGFCADFAHEFFSRVPSFVWNDLQITPPRFRRMPSD